MRGIYFQVWKVNILIVTKKKERWTSWIGRREYKLWMNGVRHLSTKAARTQSIFLSTRSQCASSGVAPLPAPSSHLYRVTPPVANCAHPKGRLPRPSVSRDFPSASPMQMLLGFFVSFEYFVHFNTNSIDVRQFFFILKSVKYGR